MIRPFLFLSLALLGAGLTARADTPLPGNGFDASHYEALWTKSPFAVASAEDPVASPDYSLLGLARIDGVNYASVLDKATNEHFLVSTDKPAHGLTLVSVNRGTNADDTSAVVKRGEEAITLKLEQAPQGGAPAMPMANAPPPMLTSPTQFGGGMPSTWQGQGQGQGGQGPPPPRFRPRLIHLPTAPPPAQTGTPAPPTPPPTTPP
jgi:hypothetical protein